MIPDGVDVELVQRYSYNGTPATFSPTALFINGQEVLVPQDAQIILHPLSPDEASTVTLTMFVRSFSMRSEPSPTMVTADDMRDFVKRTS